MECMKFDVDGMYCIMMLRDYKEEIEWLYKTACVRVARKMAIVQ